MGDLSECFRSFVQVADASDVRFPLVSSLGGEGAPSFKANDDGGLSSKPAAKGAYWTKRDIRTLIRYQVRRNPDSELPFDERDIAERMGHIAVRRFPSHPVPPLFAPGQLLMFSPRMSGGSSSVALRVSSSTRTPTWE